MPAHSASSRDGRIIRLDSARQRCAIRPKFGQTSVIFGLVILLRSGTYNVVQSS